MGTARPRSVLQVGCGSFGPTHLEAWRRLGLRDSLWVADPDPEARARAAAGDIPPERIVADYQDALSEADVVDVVAATERHVDICLAALAAGKDVFVEKPLTLVADEATPCRGGRGHRARAPGRVLFSPPSAHLVRQGAHRPGRPRRAALPLGQLLGLQARAQGRGLHRERRRALSGPVQLAARRRAGRGVRGPARPFRTRPRGLSLILLTYPNGAVAKVETGYIQPGRQPDNVVANALTTKAIEVCGSEGALEIDYQAERLVWHRVRHELQGDGFWRPVFGDAMVPKLEPRGPVEVVMSELAELLGHVERGTRPAADVHRAGVDMALLYEAITRSARQNRPVRLEEAARSA